MCLSADATWLDHWPPGGREMQMLGLGLLETQLTLSWEPAS